jgi:hypothetical protein
METGNSSKGGRGKEEEDVDELLRRLDLHEDDGDDFVWEEDVARKDVQAKWLAIARVLTNKGFSPSALYADMRSAWNPAKDVRWRQIEDNLFTVQFGCLGDWNTAMLNGPWLFRNQALILLEYDGFTNPRSIKLDKIAVWARVLKLPDNYLEEQVIKGMCRKMGKITEVQIQLPAGYVGAFVRLRVDLDINKKLERFVSITRAGKKDWYQVKYEKMPTFCNHCGLLGHWYEECGTGEHDPLKFEWGDFILGDEWKNRGGGRGATSGRGATGRGSGRGRGMFGRGHGRGNDGLSNAISSDGSWRWNATHNKVDDLNLSTDVGGGNAGINDINMQDNNPNLGKKRVALNSNATEGKEQTAGAMVLVDGKNKVASMIGMFDDGKGDHPGVSPQKNANKKKLKGVDGGAVDNSNVVLNGSAASQGDGRQEQ